MSIPALYLDEYGTAALVDLASETRTLTALQRLVDGLVDCVDTAFDTTGFHADIWVNDEGLWRNDFTLNLVASFMANQSLVGPVVICNHDHEGETTGIATAQLVALRDAGLSIEQVGQPYTVDEIVAKRQQMAAAR